MLGQLEVIDGPDRGRVFPLADGQTLQVGRGVQTETRLCDPFVSRLHFQIKAENGACTLTDLGGAGGTTVNGAKVGTHVLRGGDVIAIGDTRLVFHQAGVHDEGTVVRLPGAGSGVRGAATPAPRAAVDLPDLPGTFLDHYEVGPLVAQGGSSAVFRGKNARTGQEVALKVLLPELSQKHDDRQRMARAMRTVLPLRHPNLVSVYGAGVTGPFCWMAMEFVEGESLAQVIARIGTCGILDWRHALRYMAHVARALDHAHKHGTVHRNVTPTNILARKADNVAKLGDLILAKALEGAPTDQITRRGAIVGDLAYMSPEQTLDSSRVDWRSDLYGLGATAYALLTGRPPCEGKTPLDTVQKIRSAEPSSPRKVQLSIPEPFEKCVLKTLAKKPEDRYQSAAELLAELDRIAKAQGLSV